MSVAPPRELQRCTQLLREGRFAECRPVVLQLAARFPADTPVMRLVVQCLGALGEHHAALYHAKRMLAMNPRDAGSRLNVARLHARLGETDEAVSAFDAAIRGGLLDAAPELAQLLLGCGRISDGLKRAEAYAALIEGAGVAEPTRLALQARLSLVRAQLHFAQGDVERCIEVCQSVDSAEPDVAVSLQAVKASCMNYLPGTSRERVLAEHRRFGELLENAIPDRSTDWQPSLKNQRRPLRIGVISPDMRTHSVAVFALPLLRQLHMRASDFYVTVFHVGGVEDATTTRLREHAHAWVHLPHQSPDQIATVVRTAGVDIAIELSGLTDTLGVCTLAHGCAPVTVTAIGYPNTCGTKRVQFRLVDGATDPANAADDAVEKLVRLDPCFLCYSPPTEGQSAARSAPRQRTTFGCFNAAQKWNGELARCWREVLEGVPESTLLLKATGLHEVGAMEAMRSKLAAWGLPLDRVRIAAATRTRAEHLAMYGEVDIALDTYPYHGTTTTCEALFMGVPVVCLAGDRHVSRVGVSLLEAVGLRELVTRSPSEYVAVACGLAKDAARLTQLHDTLRGRMLASSLCNESAYGERVAAALCEIWADACKSPV